MSPTPTNNSVPRVQIVAWSESTTAGRRAAAELAPLGTDAPRTITRPLHRSAAAGRRAEAAWVAQFDGLCIKAATAQAGRGVAVDDLVQEARIALLGCTRRWDPTMEFEFTTYAYPRVHGAVLDTIREQARAIRLPRDVVGEVGRVARAREEFETRMGRPATPSEVAAELGVPLARVRNLDNWSRPTTELTDAMAETLADTTGAAPDAALSAEDELRELLAPLPIGSRQRAVMELRFGIDGSLPRSQAEVGLVLSISQPAVAGLEKRAIAALALAHAA